MIDKNLLLWHLTISQRAGYMCQYATYQSGEPKKQYIEKYDTNSGANGDARELTVSEAAAMAQVSERSIQHACSPASFGAGLRQERARW